MTSGKSLTDRQAERVLYTWTAQKGALPIEIASGQGARFTATDGSRWLDLGSMVWNANLGHAHPAMTRALAEAAGRGVVPHAHAVFPDKVAAAERLLSVAPPGLAGGKVFLCLSGAEANENAIKMARLVTGRRRIVYRSRSYHGATLGMLSYSGDPRRAPFDPGIDGGIAWDDPYSAAPCAGDLDDLLGREGADTVAAVLLEGVTGTAGVRVPPPGYHRRIREVCDRRGVLYISDEVLSGFGRTGHWFAVDRDGVSPDLLTSAKGLTAGYAPGGAVVASPRIARHFDDHVLSCGLTAYAHPLTCAAIAAAIDTYRAERLVERARALGEWLRPRLGALAASRPCVSDVRGLGLLWAVDLAEGGRPAAPARTARLATELRARRLHVHQRDATIFLAPPLIIGEADLEEGLAGIAGALDAAWS